MLESSREGFAAKSQKTTVKCLTCGLSESFYSSISVKHFKLNHAGHEVVEELPGGREVKEPPPVSRAPSPGNGRAEQASVGTKLSKLEVELAAFPALSRPVFRIRGIKQDGTEAFVQVVVFEEGARIRDIVAKGQYTDKEFSEELFFWDADSVEYSEEVMHLLGIRESPSLPVGPEPAETAIDTSTVRSTTEDIFGTQPRRKGSGGKDTVFPSYLGAPPLENEAEMRPSDEVVPDRVADVVLPPHGADLRPQPTPEPIGLGEEPESQPRVAAPPPPAPEPARSETKAAVVPEPKLERPKEAQKRDQVVEPRRPPVVSTSKPRPREAPKVEKQLSTAEEEHLLVSKSWYIQGGDDNKKEAVRLSKVLSAFRWKVEPIYTLGVMLDDIVSIETSRNEISGTLIRRIEDSGYMLSAVTSDQGKVVAWFKRVPELRTKTKSQQADRRREIDAIDAATGAEDSRVDDAAETDALSGDSP